MGWSGEKTVGMARDGRDDGDGQDGSSRAVHGVAGQAEKRSGWAELRREGGAGLQSDRARGKRVVGAWHWHRAGQLGGDVEGRLQGGAIVGAASLSGGWAGRWLGWPRQSPATLGRLVHLFVSF